MEDQGSAFPDTAMEDPESASLQAAMDAPITASFGPMGPLLRQLHSRPKGVGEDKIQLLKDGLVGLCISLKDGSEAEGASLTAKWWMKEVRELCYDTQDYLDEVFMKCSGAGACRSARLSATFRVGSKLEWRPQIGKKAQGKRCGASRLQKISTKKRNLKRRPRKVAISFSELMARVEVLADVSKRFELGPKAIKPDRAQAGVRPLTTHLYLQLPASPASISVHSDAGGLSFVGVQEPVNKLVNLLAFDDDNQKQLKVVSIFGFPGVGKTNVATTLYRNFRGKFQCRAFLRVSRTPDMMGILTSILSQIKAPQVRGFPDAQDLIDNIREHLQGKRYFIIIDDLWTTSVWNIISRAFPDDDCCSRIVTTTEAEDISLACCSYDLTYIFQMSPLNDDQSRKLFFSRVFGSEDGCPPEFREVSYGIIRQCGGSPLATVVVASMLAWEPNLVMERWKHIQDSLSSIVSTNPTSQGTKEILNLIYNYLPPHLKTCLLHLGLYPEGYMIWKDDLVKQWVAEGFLGAMEEGQNTEKTAGAYFDELVSREMVQAGDINYSGEVLSCTVHQIVLDFIRDKSMEENFAITVDYFQSTLALPDKVRRLSVQFGGAKGAKIPEGIIISQVRSLLFFGFFKCVPLILGYGLLRVLILHIWADEDKIIDLSRISELCRLTYLKVKCNITIKLPAKIGGIQDLETLEVDARLCFVPSDIVHLEKLLHLRLPSESYLPHGVGHMTSLRTLGYFDIGGNSEDNVKDLGKLTNLKDLQLTFSTVQAAENLEKNLQLLGSILEKLSILQSVTLVPTADSDVNTLQDDVCDACMSISRDSLSSLFPAPALLERIELLPRICIFPRLPKWFEQLGKLRTLKIAVRELWGEDIAILKALPALAALSLYVQTTPVEIIVFDKTGFLALSYFKFRCSTPSLKFESDAMPNLLKLKLSFNAASRVEQHVTTAIRIEHLSGLKEISTKIRGAGAISIEHLSGVKQISTQIRSEGPDPEWGRPWMATISNDKNNPTINIQLVGCLFNGNPSTSTEEIPHVTQDKDKVEGEKEELNDIRNFTTQPLSSSHLLTPGSNSVASSPLEKPQPIGTKIVGRREFLQQYDLRDQKTAYSLEHKLFGQERHPNLAPSPWRPDRDPSCQSDSSLKAAALFHDVRRTNANGVYNENGLFSSSLSDIFDKKLRLTSKNALLSQPTQKVDLNINDEPFELTEEIEAQIIGDLLPDDDELLSDVLDEVGYAAHANNGEDVEDDIFYTGGGMELETDENKKLQELNGGSNDRLGFLNGALNGEHPHGEHPSRTLFVRNINSNVEDSELKLIFEHYGDIRTLYTACKHRGFVMISYYDTRSARNAMRALQNKPLRRRKLDIHYSIPKDNPSEKDVNQGTLVVFNIDPSVTNDDLHRLFGDYGEIKEIRDTQQRGHHKIIEFYDIRGAEAALRALNRNDIAGKKIKVENSNFGGTRSSLMQHMSPDLGQEMFGVYKLGNPSTISPSRASFGSTNLATNTSTGLENGSIQGMLSGVQASMSPFRDAPLLGLSSTRPQSLSSPVGITSGVNQATLGELSHLLGRMNGHMNYSFQGMGELTSGTPYNTMTPIGISSNSRAVEALDSRHLPKVGSGNLNGHSFDRAEGAPGFPRSGSLPLHGQHFVWNNSNNIHHHPNSPVLWPNPVSFVNSVPSRPPAQMHGLPRPPSHMLESVAPVHHHHVGSAPAINPSDWDRRHGFSGDFTEASSFHSGSVGSIGFPGSPQLHPVELNNIFFKTIGICMDPAMSPALIGEPSPQQRGPFHGRNPVVPFPSFDSSGERIRSRRNELSANQSDNKRQYELDVDCILRGEDSRTTLMIKNIPNKYTSKMLLTAIDENHKGTYDFIYLPIDFKNKCNVGYAFINMTNPQHIVPFYQTFNGKKWEKFNSEKVASLAYARIQGKSALIGHFQNSSLMNEDKRCRPILFHSNGPNAGDQEPFPMGANIRARSGRSRTPSGEENHQDTPSTLASCDTSSSGAESSGPTKETE